ncbi:undecaprenyl-phosphate galactose phosphotransferase WbaP [Granulosicoccus sp.]|nr:undecaprenyl-phosphate galactose phosphotransferase WbaP [Granulosicoccus sp.]
MEFDKNAVEMPSSELVTDAPGATNSSTQSDYSQATQTRDIHPSYIWSLEDNSLVDQRTDKLRSPRSLTMKSIRMQSLFCADVLAITVSVASAYWIAVLIRLVAGIPGTEAGVILMEHLGFMVGVGAAVVCIISWSWGHYTRFRPFWTEFFEILKTVFYLAAFSFAYLFAIKLQFSRLWVVSSLVLLLVSLPLFRYMCRRALHYKGWWLMPTCIVGVGKNAVRTAKALSSDYWMGHKVIGFVDLEGRKQPGARLDGLPVFHSISPIVELNRSIPEKPCVVFALESSDQMHEYRHEINKYIMASSHATMSPPISGLPLYGAEIINVYRHDSVIVKLQNKINCQSSRVMKRVFDLTVSGLMLVALAPLLAGVALLIRRDGGSVVYGHKRIGLNGVPFYCLKFRSMLVDSDELLVQHLEQNLAARLEWEANQKLRHDPRVTSIGHFLRKTSLDELPQLWNVIKGEMSLVGPRPIVMCECEKYGENLPYYLSMLPGITGLWQSSGRSDTDYRYRVSLDVWYARNWSLWQDFVILIRTPVSLIKVRGAY